MADRVGADAIRRFRAEYPQPSLAPVVVVIPALDEDASIGGVLARIPPRACGLAVDTIVVDDGSRDRTGEIAREHGAYVARRGRNSGQGAAFRVGYRLAWEHGARYVVTLDADGQWDPDDIPGVLQPVVDGEADLVLGSRVLGHAETRDAMRHAGVRVFALLVRLLTGVGVTDTSSGLRAMVAEVGVVRAPGAGPVPELGAPARRHLPRVSGRRATRGHADARGRPEQEGTQRALRAPLRARHPADVVARAPLGRPRTACGHR